tara:strand:+ start:233 stop:1075 length:843 start_codon:yes stop_codon:yes gene_type:complete
MLFHIKLISKIAYSLLKIVYPLSKIRWYINPLNSSPLANEQKYIELFKEASQVINTDVDNYENEVGFKIEKNWIDNLALKTQIVIKSSKLNYAHGRLLYSVIRNYVKLNQNNKISIIETGTARGFSSLCMAKALNDSEVDGVICTFDLLPHSEKIYWNVITDHQMGKISRQELLKEWVTLLEKYIVFIQGYTYIELPKVNLQRVNLAFLDGAHTYKDVMFEFNEIKNSQYKGDLIIFDDYNEKLFPGIVKAVDRICSKNNYEKRVINSTDHRSYVIATKI